MPDVLRVASPTAGARAWAVASIMRTLLTIVLGAAVVTACGPSLHYQRDASVPIPANATWAWSAPDGDTPVPTGAQAPVDSILSFFEQAIDGELTARGFRRVPATEAAFLVHFHIGRRTMVDTLPHRGDDPHVRSPGGGGVYGRPEEFGDRVIVWDEGMLVVDVLPRGRRVVAWRGIIADEIAPAAERDPLKAISEAVAKLMRGFP